MLSSSYLRPPQRVDIYHSGRRVIFGADKGNAIYKIDFSSIACGESPLYVYPYVSGRVIFATRYDEDIAIIHPFSTYWGTYRLLYINPAGTGRAFLGEFYARADPLYIGICAFSSMVSVLGLNLSWSGRFVYTQSSDRQ